MVRPVIFLAYSGEMRWRTRAGDELAATLGTPMTKDQIAQAWRTALDPAGEWVSRVLEAADKRLTEVRRGMPDAAGLVIAGDHADARAYAALLRGLTGRRPVVVLSDDPAATKKITAFAASDERWMVAVRMVSEGVDIPRLAVGVYATSVSTPLYFAQAVGRFVRARSGARRLRCSCPRCRSCSGSPPNWRLNGTTCFEPVLVKAPRRTNWPRPSANGTPPTNSASRPFQPLNASVHFDRVLFDGGEFGTAAAAGISGGGGLPRPARPARTRPGPDPAPASGSKPSSPPAPAVPAPPRPRPPPAPAVPAPPRPRPPPPRR